MMRRWLVNMIVALSVLGLASTAAAQQGEGAKKSSAKASANKMRAKVIEDKKSGVSVTRPDGWANGKKKGGADAVFRAAGDEETQIDVLVSPLKRGSAAVAFFTSFHANLHKTGFVEREVREEATYRGKKGLETEYEATSGKRKFRLIVWQYHHEDNAIIITGFFPTESRDKYYIDFQHVLEKLTVK